jgi:hypothetical protein
MSLDISDSAALVTCQNKGEDALIFRSSSSFYKSYQDDFSAGWIACRKVQPSIEWDVPRAKDIGSEDLLRIREFYEGLGVTAPSENELQKIVSTLDRGTDYD